MAFYISICCPSLENTISCRNRPKFLLFYPRHTIIHYIKASWSCFVFRISTLIVYRSCPLSIFGLSYLISTISTFFSTRCLAHPARLRDQGKQSRFQHHQHLPSRHQNRHRKRKMEERCTEDHAQVCETMRSTQ